jgi:hypothetical protein
MERWRTVITAAATALAVAAVGSAGAAGDGGERFPAGWSHAEINVTQGGVSHTLIYDRGRVQQVSPSALVLRELDNSVVTIEVSPQTVVKVNGRPATLAQIKKRFQATTLRVDGGAATLVRANRVGG